MTLRTNKTNAGQAKPTWKQRIIRGLIQYCFTFCYLALQRLQVVSVIARLTPSPESGPPPSILAHAALALGNLA